MMQLKTQYAEALKLFESYLSQNMFDKALPIGKNLAQMFEKLQGSENLAAAQFYSRIADMHFEHGYDSDAEELYKRSLQIIEKLEDWDAQEIVYSMNNLGAALGRQSKTKEALRVYKRALELAQDELNPSDPVIEGLRRNIQSCVGAPNTMTPQMQLTPEEMEAERRDQAIMNAAAMLNQQMGSSGQSLETMFPGARKINSELEYWSMLGNTGKVKLALQNGEDVNQRWENGNTALHTAASGNHVELITLLLSVGADRNARLNSGETALDLARAAGHREAVAVLMGG